MMPLRRESRSSTASSNSSSGFAFHGQVQFCFMSHTLRHAAAFLYPFLLWNRAGRHFNAPNIMYPLRGSSIPTAREFF